MNWTRRTLSASLLIALSCLTARGQSTTGQPEFPEIRIFISENQLTRLTSDRAVKMELRKAIMTLNGDTVQIKELHSRGLTSLNFERKSLSVDLDKIHVLKNANQRIKRFDLINLAMDQYLWHSRWAFLSLSELQLFPLFNTYCKVWINGKHQGIYLLVEKPNYYGDRIGSPYMIRRGYDHKIEKAYSKNTPKKETLKFRKQYESLYRRLSDIHGEALYAHLQERLMLYHYLTWLGFNYWVMNGDYSDELFLYVRPDSGRFDIIPWDYDDILKYEPHEGKAARNTTMADKLIFSTEEVLDRTIGADNFLYGHYRTALRHTLLSLTPEKIKITIDRVSRELADLAQDEEAVKVTRYLDQVPFDMGKAQDNISKSYDFLITRRNVILQGLAEK